MLSFLAPKLRSRLVLLVLLAVLPSLGLALSRTGSSIASKWPRWRGTLCGSPASPREIWPRPSKKPASC